MVTALYNVYYQRKGPTNVNMVLLYERLLWTKISHIHHRRRDHNRRVVFLSSWL